MPRNASGAFVSLGRVTTPSDALCRVEVACPDPDPRFLSPNRCVRAFGFGPQFRCCAECRHFSSQDVTIAGRDGRTRSVRTGACALRQEADCRNAEWSGSWDACARYEDYAGRKEPSDDAGEEAA